MEYDDYFFDEMDDEGGNIFDYYDDGDIPPELADLLGAYRQGYDTPPVEYDRIPVSELLQNCVVPTSLQMVQGLFSVVVMSFIFRLVAQLRRTSLKEGGVPEWMVHFASAVFGVMVLHTLFRLALLYMALCCGLCYLLLATLAARGRYMSGVAASILIVVFLVLCELWLVDPTTWHRVRGAQMVLSMKIISLAFDFGSGAIIDLPNIFEFTGYCFHVGTVIFGPWVSYEDYHKAVMAERLPLTTLGFGCWHIVMHSHSDSATILSAMHQKPQLHSVVLAGQRTLAVSKPYNIEIPRSLVEVVTNWNLPMHYWLKTYVFRAARPYGTFAAVIFTYAASSLLHGLNFQLAAVLFSLGFYSYVEYVFRAKLSRIFSACIQAKRCKEGCDHTYKQRHPLVIVTNLFFLALSVLHLAYLGLMFDSSSQEEQGYTMEHTLTKWYDLGFLSHKIAIGTYIIHLLI
ncbi:hypothetical protein BaRGS_00005089 [Batillaria attramentaria]|uniref:Protein-serine O-palmitoleoyltransferase porcupine n=1 Tax=Batillaria attramentaria TaxID=370345 RepID=A0ABD0LWL9_9CAEN